MDFKEFSEKLLALEANNKVVHEDLKEYLQKLEVGVIYADKDAALEALGGCAWAWQDGSIWGAAVVILWVDQDEADQLCVVSLIDNTKTCVSYWDFLNGLVLNLNGDYVIDGKAFDAYSIKKLLAQKESTVPHVEQQQVYDDSSIVSSSAEWKPWVL